MGGQPEHACLTASRRAGTFIQQNLGSVSPVNRDRLFAELQQWMSGARDAGLDEDDILAMVAATQLPAHRATG